MYTIVSISAVVITAIIVYVGYILAQTLQTAQSILEDVEDTTHDIKSLKNGVKVGILSISRGILDKYISSSIPKGGDKDE